MSSPLLNRVWCQTLQIKPGAYEVFYKAGLIWVTLMLLSGFTTACLLTAIAFVYLRSHSPQLGSRLYLSPEGDCRYYPYAQEAGILCKIISVRHALFWCYLVIQSDQGKRYPLVFWLYSLTPQEKRRFNALCHNWS